MSALSPSASPAGGFGRSSPSGTGSSSVLGGLPGFGSAEGSGRFEGCESVAGSHGSFPQPTGGLPASARSSSIEVKPTLRFDSRSLISSSTSEPAGLSKAKTSDGSTFFARCLVRAEAIRWQRGSIASSACCSLAASALARLTSSVLILATGTSKQLQMRSRASAEIVRPARSDGA